MGKEQNTGWPGQKNGDFAVVIVGWDRIFTPASVVDVWLIRDLRSGGDDIPIAFGNHDIEMSVFNPTHDFSKVRWGVGAGPFLKWHA